MAKMDGKYSWVICFMSFLAQACSLGFYISFGNLFVAIVDEFKTSESKAALVGSISYSLCLLFGCISSPLCTRFGCRQVAASWLFDDIVGPRFILARSEHRIAVFDVWRLVAMARQPSFFPSLLVLAENFDKNYALAVGIASSGTGAGGFIFAAITEKCLEVYGLRATFRYMAMLGSVLLVGAISYGPSPQTVATVKEVRSGTATKTEKKKIFDLKVWKNGAFVIWSIIVCIMFFVYYIPYVHLVNFALELPLPLSKASSLLGYVSVASCIGKIVFGKIADHPKINRFYLIQFSLLVVSICHTMVPLSTTYAALVTYCGVYGAFDGCFNSMLAVIVGDIVGKENLHSAIGAMYLLSSTFMMFGPPLAGYLYSTSGSYNHRFSLSAVQLHYPAVLCFSYPGSSQQCVIRCGPTARRRQRIDDGQCQH
eukprot:gene16581-18267_t